LINGEKEKGKSRISIRRIRNLKDAVSLKTNKNGKEVKTECFESGNAVDDQERASAGGAESTEPTR
jgi:hypothetical protein